jgi:hypothetical protein
MSLLLSGCSLLDPDDSQWDRRSAHLQQARELWNSQHVSSYQYTLVAACECAAGFFGTVDVIVQDGVVADVLSRSQGVIVPRDLLPQFHTVESLFRSVEKAIDHHAVRFRAHYDDARGYPTLIDVDVDRRMVDDEYVVSASALVPKQ